MKVTEITQTCSACPSQWEGKLEDGRYFYGRFRYGWLDVTAGETLNQAIDAQLGLGSGQVLFSGALSDGLDGVLSTATMLWHANLTLAEGVDTVRE